MDRAASPDVVAQKSGVDEAAPKDNMAEQQGSSFCSSKRAKINHLFEENRILEEELSQKKMDEHFLKDDDMKVKYYTGLPCFAVVGRFPMMH